MSNLDDQIRKYELHATHLRARMGEEVEKLRAGIADPNVCATTLDLRVGSVASSAKVLEMCEQVLHALKAAKP
jgi:hypothetical protein